MGRLSYISFLWKSDNLHGIHSPFVYAIARDGIYNKKNLPWHMVSSGIPATLTPEGLRLLYRLISHFKASKMFVLGENTDAATGILRAAGDAANTKPWFFSPLAPIPGGFDLAYIDAADAESLLPLYQQLLDNKNDNSICIIPGIHSTAEKQAAWDALKRDVNNTVTIDTYHLGLIFFKPGRPKQHFDIRTSNSAPLNILLGLRNLWGLLG